MSERNGAKTISRPGRGFTVAPSPLNGVKFELGIILVVGVLLFLVQERIVADVGSQILLLLGYSVLGMAWVVLRTRQITAALMGRRDCDGDGAQ